jgi:hypothetical protein
MAYSWLEEKKQQARLQKQQARARNYSVIPISQRYMTPTGAGEDGVVQPNRPTDLYQTSAGPRMVHEGEGIIHNKDGTITVVPQSHLSQMEKQYGIPGYQTGGTMDLTKPAGSEQTVTQKLPTVTAVKPELKMAPVTTAEGTAPKDSSLAEGTIAPKMPTVTAMKPELIALRTWLERLVCKDCWNWRLPEVRLREHRPRNT